MSAAPDRRAFEAWYIKNVFDLAVSPLGSRDCALQWAAWQAGQAAHRTPLTDERIDSIFYPTGQATADQLQVARACARAIELAHGIKAAPRRRICPTCDMPPDPLCAFANCKRKWAE